MRNGIETTGFIPWSKEIYEEGKKDSTKNKPVKKLTKTKRR